MISDDMSSDVLVLGGGISGLTVAFRLANRGLNVRVLEESSQAGGLLSSLARPGYEIERLYHHIFEHDEEALALLQGLGLGENIYWGLCKTGFYYEGRWFDISRPLDLLRFKPLGLSERIRLGLALMKSKREKDPERLDTVSVGEWLRLESEPGLEKVFDRMLLGKFGVGASDISAAFLTGRIRARARNRSVVGYGERFGYLVGGFGQITHRLIEQIENKGGKVKTGAQVNRISKQGSGFVVSTANGGTYEAKRIVSTFSLEDFAKAADFLSGGERERFESIDYVGVLCTCCALDRSISPFYWGTISDPSLPIGAQ